MNAKNSSGLSITSLVLGILSLVLLCVMIGGILGIIGLILGIIALANNYSGKGMAIAGITLSSISILVFIIILLFMIPSSEDGDKNAKSYYTSQSIDKADTVESESTESSEIVDNKFEVGEIAETSDFKISFIAAEEYKSNNQFMQPEDGNVFYRIEFEFENISDSDQYVSSWDFTCYADSYDMEQRYFDSMDLDATLSKGKKTKGSVFFEVPKDAKEVTLEYETNFWTEDKIIFVVK